MALEPTVNWIEDLVVTNPAVGDNVNEGDDHLRNIKTALTQQFTSLGAAAVTVTAAQINDVPNKLASFNGRTATAAVPATSDYDADQVDYDNTTSGLTATEVQAAIDEIVPDFEHAKYRTLAGNVGNQIYFTTTDYDTFSNLATVKNDGTGGKGYTFTADVACAVTISASWVSTGTGYNSGAIGLNTAATGMPATSERCAFMTNAGGTNALGISITASLILAATDELVITAVFATNVPNLTVTILAQKVS